MAVAVETHTVCVARTADVAEVARLSPVLASHALGFLNTEAVMAFAGTSRTSLAQVAAHLDCSAAARARLSECIYSHIVETMIQSNRSPIEHGDPRRIVLHLLRDAGADEQDALDIRYDAATRDGRSFFSVVRDEVSTPGLVAMLHARLWRALAYIDARAHRRLVRSWWAADPRVIKGAVALFFVPHCSICTTRVEPGRVHWRCVKCLGMHGGHCYECYASPLCGGCLSSSTASYLRQHAIVRRTEKAARERLWDCPHMHSWCEQYSHAGQGCECGCHTGGGDEGCASCEGSDTDSDYEPGVSDSDDDAPGASDSDDDAPGVSDSDDDAGGCSSQSSDDESGDDEW
jgi:hypothetical protein